MDALTVAKTEVDWKPLSLKHQTAVGPDGAEKRSSKQNDVSATQEQSEEPYNITHIVELTSGNIAGSARGNLEDIVREFKDVLAVSDSEFGATNQVYHHINTGDSRPVNVELSKGKQYRGLICELQLNEENVLKYCLFLRLSGKCFSGYSEV